MTPAGPAYAVPLTRREAALRQLRDEIVTGALKPGAVLKDAEIAARLQISITPVREAIGQLAAEGLVDIAPNRVRRVTLVTHKDALELIDVMGLLACAGFEQGVDNLTDDHLETLRLRYAELVAGLDAGDAATASLAGTAFSTVLISASGNRELQMHVDLVVARTQRLIALTAGSDIWPVWVSGYRDIVAALEGGDPAAATARYRLIYREFRAVVEAMLWDSGAPSGQPAGGISPE